MLPKEESLVEYLYPIFNWKNIWKNYMSLFIYSIDKEIMYKYLHICHATNKNLYTMKLINTSNCRKCSADREQTQLHIFYECDYVKDLFMWLLRVLYHVSLFRPTSNIRFIYLDNKFCSIKQRN